MNVEMNSVVKGETQKHTDELKSDWHFVGVPIEPVESTIVFGDEHVEIGIEDLFSQ